MKLIEELEQLQIETERKILVLIANKAKEGLASTTLQQAQLQKDTDITKELKQILTYRNVESLKIIKRELLASYYLGVTDVNKALELSNDKINKVIPKALLLVLMDAINMLNITSMYIFRTANNTYQSTIINEVYGVISGVDVVHTAVVSAVNRYADDGITSYMDASGRKWGMPEYTTLNARTMTAQANLQGHMTRSLELGYDLMQVSAHSGACPLCEPFSGVVLSISGKAEGYIPLEQAQAEGLFHANCRHSIHLYDEEYPVAEAKEYDASKGQVNSDLYNQQIKQRYLERNIRKWARREDVSMTPQEKVYNKSKKLEWTTRAKAHSKATGVSMRRV